MLRFEPAPVLFLDFDDTICLNMPYGGQHLLLDQKPSDLYQRLWHRAAVDVLVRLIGLTSARIVITSSWLRFLDLEGVRQLFRVTELDTLAEHLHPRGEAPQPRTMSRMNAIDAWLRTHDDGSPYLVIDDVVSGTGLRGSFHDEEGRVILCDENIGLLDCHFDKGFRALRLPR